MEPSENIVNYKMGIFYFNKIDNRVIVPKKDKMLGWTLNFAHFKSYLGIAAVVACIWLVPYLLVYFKWIK
jgi:uncharacterized membrane protein